MEQQRNIVDADEDQIYAEENQPRRMKMVSALPPEKIPSKTDLAAPIATSVRISFAPKKCKSIAARLRGSPHERVWQ
jgi:hypothetical protein